jgi:hypothetical protein
MRRSYDHTGAFQESLFGHAFHDVTTSFAAGSDGDHADRAPASVRPSRQPHGSPFASTATAGHAGPAMMGTIGACASGRADRAAGCSSAR